MSAAKSSKSDKPEQVENADGAAEQQAGETQQTVQTPTPAQEQQAKVVIDDSNVAACYANFCRVSSTPEELVLDVGLNPNPLAQGDTTIKVSQRIILNHYTAKRLLGALSMSLQRHEQAFGALEIDFRKRLNIPPSKPAGS